MIIVSGISRSGTSAMTRALRDMLGEDRLVGESSPRVVVNPPWNLTPTQISCIQYVRDNFNTNTKEEDKARDMNPEGFWECPFTIRGINYSTFTQDYLKEAVEVTPEKFCKVVNRGLWQSNPEYISKIVYMLRNPLATAQSQENFQRDIPKVIVDNEEVALDEPFRIFSPLFFLKFTHLGVRWIVKNKPDIHIVNYDDLVDKPEDTLQDVCAFLNEGDYTKAVEHIRPDLRRSNTKEIPEGILWDKAREVYALLNESKFQEAFDILEDPYLLRRMHIQRWHCPRRGVVTCDGECEACYAGWPTANFREASEIAKIDWRNEPCLYECGFNDPEDYVSIKHSIKHNFWEDYPPREEEDSESI